MHTFFHWVWAKMAIGFICSCILRSYFYGLVVERCRRFLLQDRQLCVKRRAEQVECLWCEIPVCPGAARPGDSQMCRLAVPPMQQNWRHPPLFFILFPLYLFKIGLCCNQLFQHNPQHVSGFSKPDLPHARMLPRWALEITAMKYVGYVYVLALALGCPLVLFPLQFNQGCCHLAQVCPSSAPVHLPGWEPRVVSHQVSAVG